MKEVHSGNKMATIGLYKKGYKSLLHRALKDEKEAPVMYNRLLKNTNKKSEKKIIRGIIKQEKNHLRLLKTIKRKGVIY